MIVEELAVTPKSVSELVEYDAGRSNEIGPAAIRALEWLTAPSEEILGGLGKVTLGQVEQHRVPASVGPLSGIRYPESTVHKVVEDHKNPNGVFLQHVPL